MMFVFQNGPAGLYIYHDKINAQYESVKTLAEATVFNSWSEVALWVNERQLRVYSPALPLDWRMVEVKEIPRQLEVVRVLG